MHSLLNNPAIIQALHAQNSTPAEEPLTPGQTTRFGRISRPPVMAEQESLAIPQQIIAGDKNGGARQQSFPPPRTSSTSKRAHSTLRESSIPRSRSPTSVTQSPPLQSTDLPLARPQPAPGGRPRRGETLSKEERAERRRVQNTLSGASTLLID